MVCRTDAILRHVASRTLATEHHPEKIDRNDMVEVPEVIIFETAMGNSADASVVEHDVETTEPFYGKVNQR